MTVMDTKAVETFMNKEWKNTVLPTLEKYIRIPNQSPAFDPEWATNGYQEKAAQLLFDWAQGQKIKGMKLEMVQDEGRTPLLFAEVPATGDCTETVLMYGHLDKQPPMTDTWDPKYGGPWDPKLIGDKLYGRGGADDGYSIFAALLAVKSLQLQNIPHARIVLIVEACEESGSVDLPHYIERFAARIQNPSLIVCLDSGCGNYDQFWITTSLRGMVMGVLRVDILEEGVHSGNASGIVPDSFRIARQLISRIEDQETGALLVKELFPSIPSDRQQEIRDASKDMGDSLVTQFPFVEGAQAMDTKHSQLLQNQTWEPTLTITGVDGLPPLESAGNVLRQQTSFALSFRLPPTCDAKKASEAITTALQRDVPYNAKATFDVKKCGSGWNSPSLEPWLRSSIDNGSMSFFGKSARAMGNGGSIPFMGMLGEKFPEAQFVVTGVLGPNSNAHGPNEFLHVPQAKRTTCVVASVLQAHLEEFASRPKTKKTKA